eukprot:3963226-Pleurochrysis_carterae.AAC.4
MECNAPIGDTGRESVSAPDAHEACRCNVCAGSRPIACERTACERRLRACARERAQAFESARRRACVLRMRSRACVKTFARACVNVCVHVCGRRSARVCVR